jgi:hypothetical protein
MKKGLLYMVYSVVSCTSTFCVDLKDNILLEQPVELTRTAAGVYSALDVVGKGCLWTLAKLGEGVKFSCFDKGDPRLGFLLISAGTFAGLTSWIASGTGFFGPLMYCSLLQYFAINASMSKDILSWDRLLFCEVGVFTFSTIVVTKILKGFFGGRPASAQQQQVQPA